MGKEKASRPDYTASEDDNILVQGVASNEGALGYFGVAYYVENKDRLKAVAIDDEKPPIMATARSCPPEENVLNGTYQPLSRPLFLYVNVKALERPEVREFVLFCIEKAPQLVREVGYIPLPDKVYQLARERVEKRITGSAFGAHGSQVGGQAGRPLQDRGAGRALALKSANSTEVAQAVVRMPTASARKRVRWEERIVRVFLSLCAAPECADHRRDCVYSVQSEPRLFPQSFCRGVPDGHGVGAPCSIHPRMGCCPLVTGTLLTSLIAMLGRGSDGATGGGVSQRVRLTASAPRGQAPRWKCWRASPPWSMAISRSLL
ncbi:MAG: hypothetical protein KatS3mg021_0077 [Fimbriimonadales bacterium]|nr:MAG: hypothetical protein KatS3mg021_0077 [Fimbriimonadales bacterium]